MNLSKNDDYSQFGFQEEISEEEKPEQEVTDDYSQFGFQEEKPKEEKVGKFKSALYGLYEGVLGIPGVIQYGINELSQGVEQAYYGEKTDINFEKANPILSHLSKLPESEGQSARRIRAAAQTIPISTIGGIPGILAGLVGSQAGQTVREVYGKDGKFDTFGLGEVAAIGADIVAGAGTGIATSIARNAPRTVSQQAASQAPSIFRNPENAVQRAVVKNTIQGEKQGLQNIINNFSQEQVKGFETQMTKLSPYRFSNLTESSASTLKKHADEMFLNTQLRTISPIQATPEQGGRAIQEAANTIFNSNVLQAERVAYGEAREAATGITGAAPKTIEQAKVLRAELLKNTPTPEQQPVINFLNGLISDLETTTPASTKSASIILDANGKPIFSAQEIPASSIPTQRGANDLVDLVQRSNQAVNYESELRQQSHRLKPIVNTLRQEVGGVLSKEPKAEKLYQKANKLHAHNAETWGTKYMSNVRFNENPESIIGKTKIASNMKNLKTAIDDPSIQALAERLVIEQISETGASNANRNSLNKLGPELSVEARNAGEQLTQFKDPLTSSGGRAAVRNEILQDAAQSVSTGKRPERILDLMQSVKGYNIVRESLSGSPESRRLFNSFQRLFIEDVFGSVMDKSGQIDFGKARNIVKNNEVRQVIETIGGPEMIQRFNQLEGFANNLERNIALYKNPETQSLFKNIFKEAKNIGLMGAMFKALHVPTPVIVGLGIGKATGKVSQVGLNAIRKKVLSNPKAVRALESISLATTQEELERQLLRFLKEIEKVTDDE